MAFIYTQSDLQSRINARVQGKIGILISAQEMMNGAVRELKSKVDLRSAIRKATLSPNLYNGIFDYTCPSDLQADKIIDIPAQAIRADGEWQLTPAEEFDRQNGKIPGLIAIDTFNGTRVLKLASQVNSNSIIVAELDSTTSGGGTWAVFGDATNLARDDADYIKGNGALKWDISAAGGTTAGIVNTAVSTVDLTDYLGGTSSFFVWTKINSTTNITNYILRFGTNSSNYYSKTVTAQADGTAFAAGWNLLRFDISSLTQTGTVTNSTLNYFAIYMTKAAGKISETDYKFDWLVLKKGVIHNTRYYSKYGWQSSAAAYKENSTVATDLVVADTDEYELIVKQGIINAKKEIGYPENEITSEENKLNADILLYAQNNPSQAKIHGYNYYDY